MRKNKEQKVIIRFFGFIGLEAKIGIVLTQRFFLLFLLFFLQNSKLTLRHNKLKHLRELILKELQSLNQYFSIHSKRHLEILNKKQQYQMINIDISPALTFSVNLKGLKKRFLRKVKGGEQNK